MGLRWEGHVWRKKKTLLQGLCFYIYNPSRQAEPKEGYLRQRHLRNKLWIPCSSMVHGHYLKPGCGTLALVIPTQSSGLCSPGWAGVLPYCSTLCKWVRACDGLGDLLLSDTSGHRHERIQKHIAHVMCAFVCGTLQPLAKTTRTLPCIRA